MLKRRTKIEKISENVNEEIEEHTPPSEIIDEVSNLKGQESEKEDMLVTFH